MKIVDLRLIIHWKILNNFTQYKIINQIKLLDKMKVKNKYR